MAVSAPIRARTLPCKLDRLIPGEALWPRLSETLTGPRHPDRCQKCGRTRAEIDKARQYLQTYQECAQDEDNRRRTKHDVREQIFLNLCTKCNKEDAPGKRRDGIVARHPRFYHLLPTNVPQPGVMTLCVDCAWRDGMHCSHPETKANGGQGTLLINFPQSFTGHIKAGSASGLYTNYPAPPTSCSGREEVEAAALEFGRTAGTLNLFDEQAQASGANSQ